MTTTATLRMMTRCRKCRTAHAEDVPGVAASEFYYFTNMIGIGKPHRTCRNCGAALYFWKQLHAKHNPKVACTAKCVGATGPSCECSCAGKNHGGNNL